ncbi:MAG: lysylphosphatidylglycerol synthase transmembrane domain-containing protein [Candidatus Shapirobacteria bacterium]
MFKKVLMSKYTRYIFSLGLLYFAFQKVNLVSLIKDLISVPWWLAPSLLAYLSITMFLGGWRWAILVLEKVRVRDVLAFTKAVYLGGFYGIFFPTPFAGDLIKWTTLIKAYPYISKTRFVASILIDRVVGFTALCFVALLSLIAGWFYGYKFPNYLWFVFVSLNVGLIIFYTLAFLIDFQALLSRFSKLNKLGEIAGLLHSAGKKDLWLVFVICLISEPIWMSTTWFIALVFGLNLHLLDVLIFMPIIALVLVLPISVAGFGARETLFVYFFSTLGLPVDKILAVSTFNGILGIFGSLIGGLLTFF